MTKEAKKSNSKKIIKKVRAAIESNAKKGLTKCTELFPVEEYDSSVTKYFEEAGFDVLQTKDFNYRTGKWSVQLEIKWDKKEE